jgi:hypothetical protein
VWLIHDDQAGRRAGAFQLAPAGHTTGGEIVFGKVPAHRLSRSGITIDDQDIAYQSDVLVHIFDSRQSLGSVPISSILPSTVGIL